MHGLQKTDAALGFETLQHNLFLAIVQEVHPGIPKKKTNIMLEVRLNHLNVHIFSLSHQNLQLDLFNLMYSHVLCKLQDI